MFPLSLCCEIVFFFVLTGILGLHPRRGYMTILLIQVLAAIMITVITITTIESEEEKKNHFFFRIDFFFLARNVSKSIIHFSCVFYTPLLFLAHQKVLLLLLPKEKVTVFCTNVNKTRIEKSSPW